MEKYSFIEMLFSGSTLLFSLEMSRNEIISKSVNCETLIHCLNEGLPVGLAKAYRGVGQRERYLLYTNDEKSLISRSVGSYGTRAEHIYIIDVENNARSL